MPKSPSRGDFGPPGRSCPPWQPIDLVSWPAKAKNWQKRGSCTPTAAGRPSISGILPPLPLYAFYIAFSRRGFRAQAPKRANFRSPGGSPGGSRGVLFGVVFFVKKGQKIHFLAKMEKNERFSMDFVRKSSFFPEKPVFRPFFTKNWPILRKKGKETPFFA